MNVNISWIPRADSKDTRAAVLDMSKFGQIRQDASGLLTVGSLGTQLLDDGVAKRKLAHVIGTSNGIFRGDPEWTKVQDAAADFLVSGLERVLGPGSTIQRGRRKPWLFVPRDGKDPIIPSQNLLTPGWRTVSYLVEAPVGQAMFIEPHNVRKLPHVDFLQTKKEHRAHYYGVKYSYTIPELWEADKLGQDVIAKRADIATLVMDKFRERTTGWGEGNLALPGMFTLGDALLANGGAPFSGGGVDATNMMRRIQAWNDLYFRANDEENPDSAIIPRADLSAMKQTYFGTNSEGESVFDRASRQFDWIRNAKETERLSTGSADGTRPRWVLWSQDPDELYNEHTETMVFGPFQDYMNVEFVLLRRQGGVVSKRPERVLYVDFNA